jgi:PTH1 family peptidyl-tRNA hydrolase
MKLIVGLGNPGNTYALTRHNIGFIILDYLAEYLECEFKAGKGEYYIVKGKFKGEEFMLLKPTTYMNNSGIAVKEILELFPDTELKDVLIVFDDFQLKLGTIRIREQGSDGGHNGIASVIYHLNSMEVPRLRIGIGRGEVMKKDEFVDFVLSNFTEGEIETIKTLLPTYKECVLSFIKEPFKSVMNRYNKHFLEEEKEDGEESPNI